MTTILISGASSGFGAGAARRLADDGHIVYASMRDTEGRNAAAVADAAAYAHDHGVDLRTVEMDVSDDGSVERAVRTVLDQTGGLDVVIHNAGHMVTGPAEAFTTDQLAQQYDVNVLSTQRLNRAALPNLRDQGHGLLLWISSTSVKGGTPPYLGPYFAAKAAMDSLAVSYAAEVERFGIETVIVVPGSFTSGTNHFAHSGHPDDSGVEQAYETHYAGLMEQVAEKLASLFPTGVDASIVADEVARVVALPAGTRPFRVHVDPANDGSAEVSAVADRIQREFKKRIGLDDLVEPQSD